MLRRSGNAPLPVPPSRAHAEEKCHSESEISCLMKKDVLIKPAKTIRRLRTDYGV
jgi:hypothetical protein